MTTDVIPCPSCGAPLPDETRRAVVSEAGRQSAGLRRWNAPGGGRPADLSRCACCAMTLRRAQSRGHRCTAAVEATK